MKFQQRTHHRGPDPSKKNQNVPNPLQNIKPTNKPIISPCNPKSPIRMQTNPLSNPFKTTYLRSPLADAPAVVEYSEFATWNFSPPSFTGRSHLAIFPRPFCRSPVIGYHQEESAIRSIVRKLAFSMIELVIVVVIIGTIAAIAIPRLSRAAEGTDEASLKASLKALRGAIDMFAAEHTDQWPAQDKIAATFVAQLTTKTDIAGVAGTTPGIHVYGPYLRSMPPVTVGPNNGTTGVGFDEKGNVKMGGGDKLNGWIYNFKTGQIYANSDQIDEDGKAYKDY